MLFTDIYIVYLFYNSFVGVDNCINFHILSLLIHSLNLCQKFKRLQFPHELIHCFFSWRYYFLKPPSLYSYLNWLIFCPDAWVFYWYFFSLISWNSLHPCLGLNYHFLSFFSFRRKSNRIMLEKTNESLTQIMHNRLSGK